MPPHCALLHLAAAAAIFYGVSRPKGRVLRLLLATAVLAAAIVGGFVERRADLAWAAMELGLRDLVFFTNLSLEAAAVLLGLMWRSAVDPPAKRRAIVLSAGLAAAASASYGWFVAPLPAGMAGAPDDTGFCAQTSDDSCSAAAAAMLLHRAGIRATEQEMARLCLTRAGFGTPPLGLARGLAIRAANRGLAPELVTFRSPMELAAFDSWCIIGIGIEPGQPREVVERLQGYGWRPGRRHTILVRGGNRSEGWIEVADPSYGIERWPLQDLEKIWNGKALTLRERPRGRRE
jgi:hypothetical protein